MPNPVQPAGAIQVISSLSLVTPDGRYGIIAYGGTIQQIDLTTGGTVRQLQLGTQLGGVDISPDGRYLIATELTPGAATVVDNQYVNPIYVHRLDLTTGTTATFATTTPGPATPGIGFDDVAALSNGQALLSHGNGSGSADNVLMDISTGAFTAVAAPTYGSSMLAGSPDHSHVLIASKGSATLFDYVAGTGIVASFTGDATFTNTGVAAITSSGKLAAAQATTGAVYVYDAALNPMVNLTLLHPEFYGAVNRVDGSTIVGMAFSPDAKSLYVAESRSGIVFQLSTVDWSITGEILGAGFTGTMQFTPDGRYLTSGYAAIDLTRVISVDPRADNDLSGNVLFGFEGNDTLSGSVYLDGGAGNDALVTQGIATLVGGTGDDSYYVTGNGYNYSKQGPSAFYASVIEKPGEGYDTLYTDFGRAGDNVEKIVGTSLIKNTLIANSGGTLMIGSSGADYIIPGDGLDTISLGGGNDFVIGSRATLSGDFIGGFDAGDTLAFNDTFANAYSPVSETFSYVRSGGSLGFAEGGSVSLGITGGRFVLRTVSGAEFSGSGQYFQQPSYTALVFRPNTANLNDFNGDGHSDILWRNADGRISTWHVTGNSSPAYNVTATSTIQQNAYNTFSPAGWTLQGTADFAGDGGSDLLWRNDASGNLAVWAGTGGGGFTPGGYVSGWVDASWKVTSLGDFDGDGRDDVLWRNANGAIDVWRSAGGTLAAAPVIGVDAAWHLQGTGDFNGDGRADILWRNANGSLSIWNSSNAANGFTVAYNRAPVGLDWHVAGVGDITGDGRADILWRNDDGRITFWARTAEGGFNEAAYVPVAVDPSWKVTGLYDFNDDGRDDVLWRNDDGSATIWLSNGSVFQHNAYAGTAPKDWSIVTTVHDIV